MHTPILPFIFCWNSSCLSQILDLVTVRPYHDELPENERLAHCRRDNIMQQFQKYRKANLTRIQRQGAITQAGKPSTKQSVRGTY